MTTGSQSSDPLGSIYMAASTSLSLDTTLKHGKSFVDELQGAGHSGQ